MERYYLAIDIGASSGRRVGRNEKMQRTWKDPGECRN